MHPVVLQGSEGLPSQLFSTPLDTLMAISLLITLILEYKIVTSVIIPWLQSRYLTRPAAAPLPVSPASGLPVADDRIDSWLSITRELVEQIRRSVDNQVTIIARIDSLTRALTAEINAAEKRVLDKIAEDYMKKTGGC